MSNCKTISVCNQKGGVGKTTTTVNLGVGLAMQGKKVLLIDADPQGDLTTCLGWQDTDGLGITLATKLTDVINETMTDPMVGILHHEEGVDLVPANLELSAMEFNLVNAMSRETTLKNYLSQVKNRYDYVIIDCMIGIKDQYFGTEIEMTGITRQRAAEVVAEMFGTEAYYDGTTYGIWSVIDLEGKKWKFMSDGSIYTQRKVYGRTVDAGREYSTEMVSPKLSYDEMGKLQEVVRCLRRHGGFVNESCGQHVHIDASNHTPQSLKNALTIMYAKEDILFKALKVQERRANSYCQRVRPEVLEKIRKIPNKSITMDRVRNVWYGGRDGSHTHYDHTRYYALNLHAVFSKGTLEWRCFESTLHAGKVRANITLALAISAQAINQRSTQMKKTPISENPAFTFRTFLLRLGLIGEEYKNVRKHLLANLEGDLAWRYDKSTYECLKKKQRTEDVRSR